MTSRTCSKAGLLFPSLSGIGYIQKVHKNRIQWIGETDDGGRLIRQINGMYERLEQIQV